MSQDSETAGTHLVEEKARHGRRVTLTWVGEVGLPRHERHKMVVHLHFAQIKNIHDKLRERRLQRRSLSPGTLGEVLVLHAAGPRMHKNDLAKACGPSVAVAVQKRRGSKQRGPQVI